VNIGYLAHDYAVDLQPSPSGHITANKREIEDFSKLPSATSFIHKTLGDILILRGDEI